MKQLVIMPGGFHPFHAGHAALYNSARKAFPGADVYVAATNDTSTRPFPFELKEKLAKLAGVEPGHFVRVKSPFRAEEITAPYDPNTTQLIFVRSEKDAGSQPRPGGVKKDGTPSYLQPYTDASDQPMSQHAYMAYLPTVEFGPGITSATEIRTAWPTLNDKRKLAMVMSLYPVTQKNPKLAANVVKMLDMGMGNELAEGWKEKVAAGALGASALGGIGAAINATPPTYVDGVRYEMAFKGSIPDSAQQTVDDKGRKVYVWTRKSSGIKSGGQRTHRLYHPVEQVNEFAPGGDFKPPVPPKQKGDGPWGNDDRSKILQAVKQLLKAGNKVDWKVPGQMGHVVRVNDDAVTMKRWGKPYSKIHYSLMLTDDQDDQYQILMVKPGYYKVVSTDPQWNLEEQGVAEGPIVPRIIHPGKVSIYVRMGKGSKIIATDVPYEILDRYIDKVISKYPQFKPTDFSFKSSDKVSENQGWAATFEANGPPGQQGAGMTAGYQRRENQPVDETQDQPRLKEFILYVNGKPAAKYIDQQQARKDMSAVKKKHPTAQLELKHEVCAMQTVQRINEGSSILEVLKPDAFAALQQAKQRIEQTRQQEIDQWAQDFQANTAARFAPRTRPAPPPATPVAQPGEKHSALQARITQLDSAIKKQQQLDALSQKLEYKGLLTPAMQQDLDTRMYVRDAAADNYQALNTKLDRAIEIATNRLRTNKLAFRENVDYIEESKK